MRCTGNRSLDPLIGSDGTGPGSNANFMTVRP
jgi:hypothetical protein